MPDPIALVVKGQRPTLLEADKANELIRAINAFSNLTIQPGDRTQVIHAGDQVVLTYQAGGGNGFTGVIEVADGHLDTFDMTFTDGILTDVTAT